jgi:Adenine specific DNA methylase Mod
MSNTHKLDMHTKDKSQENFEKLKALFPNAVTETVKDGKIVHAIDKDILMQEINAEVVEGKDERYQFTWPEKKKAVLLSNAPTTKTLRPCRDKSVNFDSTKNLYIEGDNLEVLKLLQETYLGKVKMIYIDPPYNTGKDSFVYDDKRTTSAEEYKDMAATDEDGNLVYDFRGNAESNGYFHTDWLNMMYPRLRLARDLLTDDGVIFISIDDNEVSNLKKICDEIFGEQNFIAQCVRKRRQSQANLAKNISPIHEYILIYCKYFGEILNKVPVKLNSNDFKNPDNDPRGAYVTMPCTNKGGAVYSVKTPTGKIITEEWRFKKETYEKLFAEKRIVFPNKGEGKPRYKLFYNEKLNSGVIPNTWLENISSNQEATQEIYKIFENKVFDTPKPIELIKYLTLLGGSTQSIILDFFSGSATTAHAVMQLNAEDKGKRQFIMVQLPETTDEDSEAYKADYKNICEIGKERIRRAGKKILQENSLTENDLDIGFRVLKLDTTNMKDVYYAPAQYQRSLLDNLENNIKEDRSPEDLLFQVLLDLGVELSGSIASESIGGKTVFNVENNYCTACFDTDLTDAVITEIAKKQPVYAVFRDMSFNSDSVGANVEQIFKTYSPNTKITVL